LKIVSWAAPLLALLLLAGAGAVKARAATTGAKTPAQAASPARLPASGPSLLVPAVPDTLPPDSEPAPFIVPGRPVPVDSTRTREARARTYFRLAEEMEKRGQLTTALAAYNSAMVLDTTMTGVAFLMGRIYQRLGDPAGAARAFAFEMKRDPTNVEAAIEHGTSLAQAGRHDEAIGRLEALKTVRPNDDRVWSALGFAYHAAGREKDAEAGMRRARELPPERASEHRDLGALLAAQNRDREARAEYQRAMKVDPADAAVYVNLGNLERRAGSNEKALEAYRAAEARDSSLAFALRGQAQVLTALGRSREAEAVYRRWIARRPDDLGARLEAIEHFVAEGRTDIALEIARGAVRTDPHSGEAHLMLGVALDAAGDKRGALAELRRAETLAADDENRARARSLIATLRAGAPDSLRAVFAADSAAHAAPRR
jgi:tetratricopeptide (TPR) repeat protein